MSQSSHSVGNVSAPAFRAAMNGSLQALASLNSGSTEPSTTYANMLWYDTANNTLKMRSEADDAWISVGYLDQSSNAFRIFDNTQVVNASGTQTGLIGDQDTSTWEAGTGTTESLVSPAKVKAAVKRGLNATGTAPIYACRAWVNFNGFNGIGTVAIRASGNVSSITDNGTGRFTVSFTTAMEDADYSIQLTTSKNIGNADTVSVGYVAQDVPPNASAFRFYVTETNYASSNMADPAFVNVAIFR